MIATYFRIALMIAAFTAAVLLFAFAFTAAAVVVLVLIAIGLVFGRRQTNAVWIFRREGDQRQSASAQRDPKVIDHDPNDLP